MPQEMIFAPMGALALLTFAVLGLIPAPPLPRGLRGPGRDRTISSSANRTACPAMSRSPTATT